MVTPDRPYIICHMMTTIDGRITSGTPGVDVLEDYFKLYTQTEDTFKGKAWLLGRITVGMYFATGENTPLPEINKPIDTSDFTAQQESNYFMFVVDTKGTLRFDKNTVKLSNVKEDVHLVMIVTDKTPKEYLGYLQSKNISYINGGIDEIDFQKVLKTIKTRFNINLLLLEGGGLINGSLLAQDMVDEISVLITPIVLNKSGVPTIFENKTDKVDTKKYTLYDVKRLENDCIWVRYKEAKLTLKG